jgi:putative transposase
VQVLPWQRSPTEHHVLCLLKSGRFAAGVFGWTFLAGTGAEAHESIEVHRREEGVHLAARRRRNAGISHATDFNWKKKYGGFLPDKMQRLKLLEDENVQLKKISRGPDIGPRNTSGYHPAKCLEAGTVA